MKNGEPLGGQAPSYAPLVYGHGLLDIKHKESCPFSAGYVQGLQKEKLLGTTHTVRGICACMDPFQIDKAFVLELQGRELGFDAYDACRTMMKTYGKEKVLSDVDLNNVVCLAVFARHVYDTIEACQSASHSTYLFTSGEAEARFEADESDTEEEHGKRNFVKRISGYGKIKGKRSERKRSGNSIPGTPSSEPQWMSVVDEDRCRVWFKAIPNSPIISFRLDGTIDASLLDFLAIASEVDMTCKWIPYFKFPMKVGLQSAKCIARYGRFDKISHYKIDLPWPMKSR